MEKRVDFVEKQFVVETEQNNNKEAHLVNYAKRLAEYGKEGDKNCKK